MGEVSRELIAINALNASKTNEKKCVWGVFFCIPCLHFPLLLCRDELRSPLHPFRYHFIRTNLNDS